MDVIERIRRTMKERGTRAFLISDPHNIAYLTGFPLDGHERTALGILTPEKFYYVYSPLMAPPRKQLARIKGTSVRRMIARKGFFTTARGILSDIHGPVLFEDHDLTVEELRFIEDGQKRFRAGGPLIEHIRTIKDKSERSLMRKAALISDQVFKDTVAFLERTDYEKLKEADLADWMLAEAKKKGADAESFPTIVACGAGAAEPHHRAGSARLKKGKLLLLDFGFSYKGYQSDISRTIALGEVPAAVRHAYEIVRENLATCTAACASGMQAGELFDISVRHFRRYGLARYFTHALGHGIGLEVHEMPTLAKGRELELADGMVFTIEPGIYIPGKFGIRIENMIRLSDGKAHVMTPSSTELVTIN